MEFYLHPCTPHEVVHNLLLALSNWKFICVILKDSVRTSQETHYFSATKRNWLMLFMETVANCCENHTEHTDPVHTSQETHYVSAAKPNWLMLFRETVAVYCENHTEHTDPVRTSQETHYVSATKPNRLMLFRETVTVYCANHVKHVKINCFECSERWYI
jgi:thioredoxin-related protein